MIYGGRQRKVRHYVRVVALYQLDGQIVPLQILWDNERRFDVGLVGHPRRERPESHGFALRHDVMIGQQRRVLWRDEQGWFVEVPEARAPGAEAVPGIDPRFADIPC
ncbi:MAG: hypothetical protein Q4E12_01860 [Coriobacteriia bacterium]|nr:hypothetical protein [Coriobacteriia bacterium]